MKDFLKKLIEAESTEEKGEAAAAQVVCDQFRRFGIEGNVDIWDETRANVFAHIKSPGKK